MSSVCRPMGLFRLLTVGLGLWTVSEFPSHARGDDPTPGKQVACSLELPGPAEGQPKVTIHYWLFLPADYAKEPAKKWPLLLFLHGAGERGDDLELVKKHGPPKNLAAKPDLPFIVASPQAKTGEHWQADLLIKLVDHLQTAYRVEPSQEYVTGLSMGGFGTWDLIAKYPDRFAAAVPICGGGKPDAAEKIKHIPLWIFHGAKDTAVSLARSEEMVKALKEAGGEPKFTVYPEAGHDSWTTSYNNPELYTWLLAQKRKP